MWATPAESGIRSPRTRPGRHNRQKTRPQRHQTRPESHASRRNPKTPFLIDRIAVESRHSCNMRASSTERVGSLLLDPFRTARRPLNRRACEPRRSSSSSRSRSKCSWRIGSDLRRVAISGSEAREGARRRQRPLVTETVSATYRHGKHGSRRRKAGHSRGFWMSAAWPLRPRPRGRDRGRERSVVRLVLMGDPAPVGVSGPRTPVRQCPSTRIPSPSPAAAAACLATTGPPAFRHAPRRALPWFGHDRDLPVPRDASHHDQVSPPRRFPGIARFRALRLPGRRWYRPHPRATADVADRALRCVDRLRCSVAAWHWVVTFG